MTWCNASVTVVEGEEATLHCHVSGQPRPRVTWRRPELGTRPVLEAAPGGGFLVQEAVVRDSGVYTCTAANRFGQEATCNTSLIVIGKLNFISNWAIISRNLFKWEPFIPQLIRRL